MKIKFDYSAFFDQRDFSADRAVHLMAHFLSHYDEDERTIHKRDFVLFCEDLQAFIELNKDAIIVPYIAPLTADSQWMNNYLILYGIYKFLIDYKHIEEYSVNDCDLATIFYLIKKGFYCPLTSFYPGNMRPHEYIRGKRNHHYSLFFNPPAKRFNFALFFDSLGLPALQENNLQNTYNT